MPYTREAAISKALKVQTALANSTVHLIDFALLPNPNVNTTKAAFIAAEATFDGYVMKTITAWVGPGYNPTGGAALNSPALQWVWEHDTDDVQNLIGGWWLALATSGDVWAYDTFPEPVSMAQAFDILPLNITLVEGQNPTA